MAKVYVSSTLIDLERERLAVLDWLRLTRHQAVDSYLPGSDTVRENCLDDVAACDLYVVILGHRYGFQPADGNPGGLSITHLEFRRAGECGIPRVALLRTSIPDVRLSDLEDVARAPLVLEFRDEVARQVRPAEFSDLQGLIQRLSTEVQGELEKRDKLSAGFLTADRALRLAPRPVFLAGREQLLAKLAARLGGDEPGGDEDAEPRLAVLTGASGAGKTSVALEYARSQLGEVEVAWQLSAEDPAVLAAGCGELAAQLGAGEGRDPVASLHGLLAASPAPWLLVFDNAPDQASVAPFLPLAGPGQVLITSRNQNWPSGQAVDVPALDRRLAAEFLVNRTADPDRRAALGLASELGGLPLALEQAAAYVQASGDSLAGYLASFRQRSADALGRDEPTVYGEAVATTWRLAFADLQQAAPGAAGLLRLLAFCAPEAIPLQLLLQPREAVSGWLGDEAGSVLAPLLKDPLVAGDAIAALRRYSLVTPAARESVSVHRLVQAVTADQMSAELAGEWQQAAAALIEGAIPGDTAAPATWSACSALLPHALAALADDSAGMARIARYLGLSGSYAAARDLQRRVLDARVRVLGPDHQSTLTAWHELAYWAGAAGDPGAARDQYAALVPALAEVFGPDHPETLRSRANLAIWTGEAGDPAAARDEYAALVPALAEVFGPDHPETLRSGANLAIWTGEAGDPAAARDQCAALLPALAEVFGPDHPDTLTTRHLLARWTGEAGDPAAARDQYAALLPALAEVLGPDHPHTMLTQRHLARWTREADDQADHPGPVRRAAARARRSPRRVPPGLPDQPTPARLPDRPGGGPKPPWQAPGWRAIWAAAPDRRIPYHMDIGQRLLSGTLCDLGPRRLLPPAGGQESVRRSRLVLTSWNKPEEGMGES